jgi:hypothetical protein
MERACVIALVEDGQRGKHSNMKALSPRKSSIWRISTSRCNGSLHCLIRFRMRTILIKISACGVCHGTRRDEGRTPPTHFPMVLGHQIVGRVADVGNFVLRLSAVNGGRGVDLFGLRAMYLLPQRPRKPVRAISRTAATRTAVTPNT